jgi:3-deoxy-manno-octulosonate cytidylyltransferase (CMP-KDO synthetase)
MGKIFAIIPARWGSTRFPGKSLALIAGKPLIQRVWERCCLAEGIDGVIIATDDMRIAEAAFEFGAEVSLTSPAHQSGTDRIAEVAAGLSPGVSHVINVQGDEPAIAPALISRLAMELRRHRHIEMITAASPFSSLEEAENPNAVKVVLAKNGDALYFSRSVIPHPFGPQAAAPGVPWRRHHGIYGYRRKFLARFVQWRPSAYEETEKLEQLRALEHGVRIRVLLTALASCGVDTPEDVPRAEAQLLADPKNHPEFS